MKYNNGDIYEGNWIINKKVRKEPIFYYLLHIF